MTVKEVKKVAAKKVKLTLIKSLNRRTERTRATVAGLGLGARCHQSVEVTVTPEIQGMITKVEYLLKIEEI
ncbi:MAG: 50S ribosomal protein L30 [Gammaproteobacteria bacterium]|nr:50S ribosomal protein L30 [Gammaproteobacteria bacterium]